MRASPDTVIAYLRGLKDGSERRYIGHNPAGGAMIVVLLVVMAATAVSGWLLTTDAFWGSRVLQLVHSALSPRLAGAGGPSPHRRGGCEPAPS